MNQHIVWSFDALDILYAYIILYYADDSGPDAFDPNSLMKSDTKRGNIFFV